ncbi:MAG: hypothetical protein U1E53_26275 [Dongiaceae bacterium]
MRDVPKRIRRLIADYAGKAEEAELRRAMLPLAEAFKRWERGELDSYALQDMIHSFDRGPARKIYSRYDRSTGYQDAHVARAIENGLIDRATVPPELLEHLARWFAFFREQREGS